MDAHYCTTCGNLLNEGDFYRVHHGPRYVQRLVDHELTEVVDRDEYDSWYDCQECLLAARSDRASVQPPIDPN